MHENFLSYIMIGLNRGFTLPTVAPNRDGRRWDGGEYFSPEQWQSAARQVPVRHPAKEDPGKVQSRLSDRLLSRLRHPWRPDGLSICR